MKERLVRFRSFWIFPLLSAGLLMISSSEPHSGNSRAIFLWWACGLLAWTLLEYAFHRFLLHTQFRNKFIGSLVNASHLAHHRSPRDPDQILVKTSFGIVLSAVIYAALWLVSGSLFRATGILTGIWTGFLYYELVHYRVHMSLVHASLLQHQRRAHFYHHFSNSEKCFGVTSPLWDYVFGTYRRI